MNAVGVEQGGQVRRSKQSFTTGFEDLHLSSLFVGHQQFDASKYGFFGDLQEGEDPGLEGSLEVRACCSAVVSPGPGLFHVSSLEVGFVSEWENKLCCGDQAGIDAPPEEDAGLATEEPDEAELWLNNEQGEQPVAHGKVDKAGRTAHWPLKDHNKAWLLHRGAGGVSAFHAVLKHSADMTIFSNDCISICSSTWLDICKTTMHCNQFCFEAPCTVCKNCNVAHV